MFILTGFGVILFCSLLIYIWFWYQNKPLQLESGKLEAWRSFEIFVYKDMSKKGFKKCQIGKGNKDNGIDVIGYKNGQKYIVQAKMYKNATV